MWVAVCEDISIERFLLRDMLHAYFFAHSLNAQVDLFSNAQALLSAFSPGKYQLLLLDIYMPGMTGMEAARLLRERGEICPLIFSTTSEEHALNSYGVYASGYLLKPYTQEQLNETLDWCAKNTQMLQSAIEISCEWEKISLPLKDIVFIEIYGRKAVFHTPSREYTSNRSLSALEQELTEDFVRCHRCYIVNMRQVATLSPEGFVLKNSQTVPIGADMASNAKRVFFDWMFKNTWEGR